MTRKHHKRTAPPLSKKSRSEIRKLKGQVMRLKERLAPSKKIVVMKEKFQAVALQGMERAEKARGEIELKFDSTPEGLVAFSKYLVEMVGLNRLDLGRASTINGILQTILRTSESGLDAIKNIEEDALHLAETARVLKPVPTKPSS